MPGTVMGGLRAARTNKQKYGVDFYATIGRKGGQYKGPKGFAVMEQEKVMEAGRTGGRKSRRTFSLAKRNELSVLALKR